MWGCHMSSSQREIYFEYLRKYKTLKIIRPPYKFFITWNIIYNYFSTKLFSIWFWYNDMKLCEAKIWVMRVFHSLNNYKFKNQIINHLKYTKIPNLMRPQYMRSSQAESQIPVRNVFLLSFEQSSTYLKSDGEWAHHSKNGFSQEWF